MLFDTHTHVNFSGFGEEAADVIKRALDAQVWMTNVGTSYATSKSAAELAGIYPKGVYATIGLHPGHTWQDMEDAEESPENRQQKFEEKNFKELLGEKIVAVGEIGLDYYRLPDDNKQAKRLQQEAFVSQLHFAKNNQLPVVIHCREAYEDTLGIITSEYQGSGIIHSYTGDWDTAKKFLDLGFYVALNGILAFDKTGRLSEVCRNLPSDRILTETDAPYLAPPPHRGKRNEPAYVKHVAEKMAEIRGEDFETTAEATFKNAVSAYNLQGQL